jgi:hypothetical protein
MERLSTIVRDRLGMSSRGCSCSLHERPQGADRLRHLYGNERADGGTGACCILTAWLPSPEATAAGNPTARAAVLWSAGQRLVSEKPSFLYGRVR